MTFKKYISEEHSYGKWSDFDDYLSDMERIGNQIASDIIRQKFPFRKNFKPFATSGFMTSVYAGSHDPELGRTVKPDPVSAHKRIGSAQQLAQDWMFDEITVHYLVVNHDMSEPEAQKFLGYMTRKWEKYRNGGKETEWIAKDPDPAKVGVPFTIINGKIKYGNKVLTPPAGSKVKYVAPKGVKR